MEKTYSQKIARAFEIADYVLLLPALFGVFMATLLIGSAPWFTAIIYTIFGIGVALMVGYFKHSRGRLSEKGVKTLWLGTAAYNILLLLPVLGWGLYGVVEAKTFGRIDADFVKALFIYISIVCAYLTVIVLSLKAYRFDVQKYR